MPLATVAGTPLIRGQWNRVGSGSYRAALWRSDGTARDAYGRTIPQGRTLADWCTQGGGGSPASAFNAWSSNAWDTKRGQLVMQLSGGGTTSGFVDYSVNVLDYSTGSWNPTGRPQEPYTELAVIVGETWPHPVYGDPSGPPLILDVNNRYPTYTDPVPILEAAYGVPGGGRWLPNAAHTSGSICYMPSVDHLFIGPHYGMNWDDQGATAVFLEYDIPNRKYILDLPVSGPETDRPAPGGQSYTAWDSTRNLVWFLWDSAGAGFCKIASYNPAAPLGQRVTVHQQDTFFVHEERFCSTVYDQVRDKVIWAGVFAPSFNGATAISIDCATPRTPHPFTWPAVSGYCYGLIHDTVADRYIQYVNGKTLLSIHPDTLAVTDLTPAGGVSPTPWSGPGTFHRFEWLRDFDDVYAVVNTADDEGLWVFPPVRAQHIGITVGA